METSETFAVLMSRVETELGHKIKNMTTCYLKIENGKSMFTWLDDKLPLVGL